MSGWYPPGVTGDELEIAGPDTEREADHECPTCGKVQPGFICTYRYEQWFVCDVCGDSTDMENLPEPEYLVHAGEEDEALFAPSFAFSPATGSINGASDMDKMESAE